MKESAYSSAVDAVFWKLKDSVPGLEDLLTKAEEAGKIDPYLLKEQLVEELKQWL